MHYNRKHQPGIRRDNLDLFWDALRALILAIVAPYWLRGAF